MARADDYFDLGTHHMPVSTKNADAQTWFNRGLIWSYGFNHEESVHCFEKAANLDPECAMAHWGIAFSLGPNYNKPWNFFDYVELGEVVLRAHQAATRAARLADADATDVEKVLISALMFRYPSDCEDRNFCIWNANYADAMRKAYEVAPSDADVAALFVDALMNITPWKLWDIKTGKPAARAKTLEIKDTLERAILLHPRHPGLLHLYIHTMEMSAHPEAALVAADRLRGLVPDSGHLNHMPTHLDILVGDYRRAIDCNTQAILADEKYLAHAGPFNLYSLYRAHNYHFRLYAAMFAGQFGVALSTARDLEAALPASLLRTRSPPLADWAEGFCAMRAHVLIRFGRWDDILALPLPHDPNLYRVTTATTHYAKGVAMASLGRIPDARHQRDLFEQALSRVPTSRTLFNNICLDILAVARALLDGEIDFRAADQDDPELGLRGLRKAVSLDDALPYDEPWGWMQPTRHALGALLLEAGRVDEAAAVYAADLGVDEGPSLPRAQQHRGNVWALHGYHECLVQLGRTAESRALRPQLEVAVAVADVVIRSSCFCRLGVEEYEEGRVDLQNNASILREKGKL